MHGLKTWPLLALALSLGVAGCGAGVDAASNNAFRVESPADHMTTAGKMQFETHAFSSSRDTVRWTVIGGDEETGPGQIDDNGLYIPPAYLRASSVHVVVMAALESDPATRAERTITVTPAISVAPQNVALTPGAQTRLYASIAEVGAGSVRWSSESPGEASAAGQFSGQHCHASHDTFTQCSVLYTSPLSPAVETANVTLRASLRGNTATVANARVLINNIATASPLENEAAQGGGDALGTSGGNSRDSANQYCCGGTLGALVRISGQPYVLSNNHVLARTDQGGPGDSILQPGLLDTDCGYAPSYTVATLVAFPRLHDPKTNVDAAVAEAASGAFDPSGAILGFGTQQGGVLLSAPPARDPEDLTQAGKRLPLVVKSGRTTGLTCGAIAQIAVDFRVNYNTSCDGSGEEFEKIFTNQIAISGDSFADSGDSGALLADQQTAQPIGMLFAGNATETFANPIQDVLHALVSTTSEKGNTPAIEMVGGDHHAVACMEYRDTVPSTARPVPTLQMQAAQDVATRLRGALMATDPAILDVAVAPSLDAPGEAALVLYMDKSNAPFTIPPTLEGVRTIVVATTRTQLGSSRTPAPQRGANDLSTLPRSAVDAAIAVKQRYSEMLRRDSAVWGVGVGKSMDNPSEAAITIFVGRDATPSDIPPSLSGLRTQLLYQDAPRAFDWKHTASAAGHRAGCSLRGHNELALPAAPVTLR